MIMRKTQNTYLTLKNCDLNYENDVLFTGICTVNLELLKFCSNISNMTMAPLC